MRLLHVFPSFEVGGQQMRAAVLANALVEAGIEHQILALNGNFECAARFSPEVSWEKVAGPVPQRGLAFRLFQTQEALKDINPDRLITYNWGAIEWAAANRFCGYPHIHIEDGFGPDEARGQLKRRVWFRRLALRGGTRVVFPSLTLYRLARDEWKLPEHRLQYVPNGIEAEGHEAVDKTRARQSFGLPANKTVIGTVATLRREKNLKRLIEAFHGLPNLDQCHLVIAGAGPELGSLRKQAAQFDLSESVSFPGFVEEPLKLLPAFDIFALSSDTEQMPLSVLEAMVASLPVASLAVGDVSEMVAEEGRRFVMGSDTAALARQLASLTADKALRQRLGFANRERVEKVYGFRKMVETYRDLFIHGRTSS